MNRPARLPVDCPRCENRGVLALDDDRTIACPLCNNWCSLCLEGVPTFVRSHYPPLSRQSDRRHAADR